MVFLLFVDVFLVVVKGTTDKLVPASMIQNKSVFELYRDVVDTMISNTGGFAAILHRHRSANRFRIIVLILASCTDSTHPHFAVGTAGSTGCNSPRHGANACHKLFLTIRAYENSSSFRTSRNFAGSVIVLVAPQRNNFRTLGSQIIDSGNNLATCANRATGMVVRQGFNDIANRSLKFLLAIWAYEPRFLVAAYRYFAGVYVFLALHIAEILGHLVAKSLTPEMTFLELMVLAFIVNSLSPRIFEACDK